MRTTPFRQPFRFNSISPPRYTHQSTNKLLLLLHLSNLRAAQVLAQFNILSAPVWLATYQGYTQVDVQDIAVAILQTVEQHHKDSDAFGDLMERPLVHVCSTTSCPICLICFIKPYIILLNSSCLDSFKLIPIPNSSVRQRKASDSHNR